MTVDHFWNGKPLIFHIILYVYPGANELFQRPWLIGYCRELYSLCYWGL